MKAFKSKKSIAFKTIQSLMASVLVLMLLVGCSKDDEGPGVPESSIKLGTLSFTNDGDCDHSGGMVGTRFLFELPYTSSSGLTITKLKVKIKESENGLDDDEIEIGFEDNGNTITTNTCAIFVDNTWYEYTYRLVSEDGIVSNSATLRIDKPSGAN